MTPVDKIQAYINATLEEAILHTKSRVEPVPGLEYAHAFGSMSATLYAFSTLPGFAEVMEQALKQRQASLEKLK